MWAQWWFCKSEILWSINEIKISYRHGYVSVEWRYEKDKENADTRENQFAFKDFIKEKENEKQKNNKN